MICFAGLCYPGDSFYVCSRNAGNPSASGEERSCHSRRSEKVNSRFHSNDGQIESQCANTLLEVSFEPRLLNPAPRSHLSDMEINPIRVPAQGSGFEFRVPSIESVGNLECRTRYRSETFPRPFSSQSPVCSAARHGRPPIGGNAALKSLRSGRSLCKNHHKRCLISSFR